MNLELSELPRGVEITGQERREDENRPRDRRFAQLLAFGNRRDAKPPRGDPLECARNAHRAKAVGVGLDQGEDRHTGVTRNCNPVA